MRRAEEAKHLIETLNHLTTKSAADMASLYGSLHFVLGKPIDE